MSGFSFSCTPVYLIMPHSSRKIVFLIILCFFVLLSSFGIGGKIARAQVDSLINGVPEDLILIAYTVPQKFVVSEALLGVQYNGVYYLPAIELAEAFDFAVDYDEGRRYLTGWYLNPENTFSIDGQAFSLTHKGEVSDVREEELLPDDLAPFPGELYVAVETLNQIWPVLMTVDLSILGLSIETEEKLPFQLKAEREGRRAKILAAQGQRTVPDNLPIIENNYRLIGRPVIDIQAEADIDADDNRYQVSVSGVQDILGTTADFGTQITHRDGSFKRPDNFRLRLRRIALGDEEYFLGVKEIRGGDIRIRQRELVSNSVNGRGVAVTTRPLSNQGEFDTVTIEGVAPAGWEIELYRNADLLEFGIVGDDGLYRFEDVQLFFGNNEIRAILYGPEGQVREDVYNYNFNRDMVQPGETEFYAGTLDTNEDFIPISENNNSESEGITATGYAFHGINKNITLFAGATQTPYLQLDNEIQRYASAGGVLSTDIGFAEIEGYKQLGKGEALEGKFLTSFFGTKVNLSAAVYNDFESQDAGFGNNAKKREGEIELQRNVRLPFGTLSLRGSADYRENVDSSSTTRYLTQQSLTWRGLRLSNRTTTQIANHKHTSTTGQINATYRLRKWRFRPSLGYSIFPQGRVNNVGFDARYQIVNDYSLGFVTNHQFQNDQTSMQLSLSKEFDKFLAAITGQWDSEDGLSMTLRASTSLGPYGRNKDYIVTRNQLANATPVQARIFLDRDSDGTFDEETDEAVAGANVIVGSRRSKETSDEEGYVSVLNGTPYGNTPVYVDETSVDDPYYKLAEEGYFVQPRPGSMPTVDLPLIETGAIDGSVFYDETGNPVEGLTLQLLNPEGEIIQTTETAYDGFYTFEFVPPGTYTVQADPSYDINIPSQIVSVNADELYYSGIDLSLYSDDPNFTQDGWGGQFGPYKPGEEPVIEQQFGGEVPESFGPQLPAPSAPADQPYGPYQPGKEPDEDTLLTTKQPAISSSAPRPGDKGMSASVKRVRIGEHPQKVRVVMDLTEPIEYKAMSIQQGKEVLIEMPGTAWGAIEQWRDNDTPILSHFRVEGLAGGGTRLVMHARSMMQVEASGVLEPHNGSGYRLYVDLVLPNE